MNELTTISNPNNQQPYQTKLQLVTALGKQLQDGTDTVFGIGKKLGLNKNQISFVEVYMSDEYRGSSGREAAARAYGYDISKQSGKQLADSVANKNLKHEGVLTLIAVIHDSHGFNDQWVDRRLKFIMDQNVDLKASLGAISEYNKLHQRIKTITEIQVKPAFDFSTFTPEELQQFISLTTRAKLRHNETKHLNLLDDNDNVVG